MRVLNFDVGRDVGSEHHLDQKDQNGDVLAQKKSLRIVSGESAIEKIQTNKLKIENINYDYEVPAIHF